MSVLRSLNKKRMDKALGCKEFRFKSVSYCKSDVDACSNKAMYEAQPTQKSLSKASRFVLVSVANLHDQMNICLGISIVIKWNS